MDAGQNRRKRDAIVQAASEVFLELGFEGASMSQIAARVGGSKRTLYGYFPSKEELFIAFAQDTSDSYIDPMLDALTRSSGPVSQTLQRFGEDLLGFLCAPSSITIWQTIIGVSGRSDVGALFFNAGPEEGMQRMAEYLQQQMDLGLMRRGDATLAAKQLGALLEAQTLMPCLFGALKDPSPEYLRDATQRAVELFLAGYGCKNTAAA